MDDHAYSISGTHKNTLLCKKANLEPSNSQQRSANEISNEVTSTADPKETAMETETLPDFSLAEVPETESSQVDKNTPLVCKMTSVKAKRKQRSVTHYKSSAKCCPYDQDPDYRNAATSKTRCKKLKLAKNVKNKRKSPKSSDKTLHGPTSVTTIEGSLLNDDGNCVPKSPVSEDAQQKGQRHFPPTKRRSKHSHGPRSQRSKRQKPSPASPPVYPELGADIVKSEPKGSTDPSTELACLVRTPTGNYELQCNNCPNTYMAATDLISHKLAAHDIPFLICEDCALEFMSHEEMNDHPCVARNRCDICGIGCSSADELAVHMTNHANDSKDFVCKVCLFSGRSQSELSRHMCGGRPKIKYSAKVSPAVMMYPTANNGIHKAEGVGSSPSVFVKTPRSGKRRHKMPSLQAREAAASSLTSDGSQPLQFVCQECLNVYPSAEALACHECSAVPSADPASMSTLTAPGVMPEVEQLAKFYSSVVFSE